MYNKIDQRWQNYNAELDKVDVSNIYEAIRTAYLRRTISGEGNVAADEVRILRKKWDLNDLSILEIGAGYGAFCRTLHDYVRPKDYTILDTKSMLRFAKAYLAAENTPCTFLDTEEPLPDRSWDLLISNVCISEIPEEHIKPMLTELFKKVNKVAIIDTDLTWLDKLIQENFDIISKSACSECNQPNHYLYTGAKL
jgi:ubiquinone/menaquinone biosynthesis C-methylase UbiE